jgi:deazaflavin-dependent oxidoreductase (nitroreductase family)
MPSRADTFKDLGFRYGPRLHRALMGLTGGRFAGSFGGMPVVTLTTIGRKSGLKRTTMLTPPIIDDSRVVLVASKGGDHRNPEWFLNLEANPEVEIAVRGRDPKPYRAREANAEEKAELWPEIVSIHKGYADYQKRTSRDIPVVICEQSS